MFHGLISMLDLDVLQNDKMISKKQQVLKSHRMEEL